MVDRKLGMLEAAVAPIITVVTVSASATLASLKGSALASTTKQVTLKPHASGIYMAIGTATANSTPLGTNSVVIDGDPTSLSTLELYAASSTSLSIIEEG